MNNLDLVVFPAMSARHSHLSRKQRVRVCKKEVVWRNALEVWKELPSSLIARGFVQVSRLAKKVIQSKGSNDFLRSKGKEGLSCEINKDFYNTEDGIARKDGQSFEAAPADPTKHAIRNHVRGSSEAWNMIFPFPTTTNSTTKEFNCL